jgi:hypothetical protein
VSKRESEKQGDESVDDGEFFKIVKELYELSKTGVIKGVIEFLKKKYQEAYDYKELLAGLSYHQIPTEIPQIIAVKSKWDLIQEIEETLEKEIENEYKRLVEKFKEEDLTKQNI